ncbi:MAG: CvpA family protein [Synergistaceae bacterium]|jgi:uncharacterized membrane protein required for colicin V production|nr:CvpA family protein [Synergistaceae bacterium]
MNITDLALLVAGSYFVIRGLFRGISGELLSLLSVAGGFFCALRYYKAIAGVLTSNFDAAPLFAAAFSMLGIFGLVFFICSIVDGTLKKILGNANLTWADKLCGALAGFAKIYIIAMMVLVSGMILAPIAGDAWVRDSRALVLAARTWGLAYPLLDRAGLIPDIEEIQREARDYILQQAAIGKASIGDDTAKPPVAVSADMASPDDAVPLAASSDMLDMGALTSAILGLIGK